MSEDKDKDNDKPKLTSGELAAAQAAAVLLVRAIVDERVGVEIFRDKATGKAVPILGRMTKVREGNQEWTTFTPLARLFTQRADQEVEPIEATESTVETPLEILTDQDGKLVKLGDTMSDEEILEAHKAAKGKDPTTLN